MYLILWVMVTSRKPCALAAWISSARSYLRENGVAGDGNPKRLFYDIK